MRIRYLSVDTIVYFLSILFFSFIYIFDSNPLVSIILFFISVLIFAISAYRNRFNICLNLGYFHLFILCFSVFCFCSALWGNNSSLAIEKGITIFELLICMSMLYAVYTNLKSDDILLRIIAYGGSLVSLYCFSFFGFSGIMSFINSGIRMENTIANANDIGMIASISSIILLYYFFNIERKIIYPLLAVVNFLVVAACGSRKALILICLGIIFLFLSRVRTKNILKKIFGIIIVVFIGMLVIKVVLSLSIFDSINERMEGLVAFITGNGSVDSSTLKRYKLVEEGIAAFMSHPILGVGIGNARYYCSMGYTYLHNNYVELLACGGIVGFIIYYMPYMYLISQFYKNRAYLNEYSIMILFILSGVIMMDYGSVSYYSKSTYFFLMVCFLHLNNLKDYVLKQKNTIKKNSYEESSFK